MARIGYARVSSIGQSLEVQLDKLKDCDKVFKEKKSGIDDKRPELKRCLDYVREGDTLVITRLDRLARSTFHLCNIAERLARKNIELHVIDQNIDTFTATGRLMFNMLSAIAQFETEVRAERQADGIAKAKKNGVQFGRQKKLSYEEVVQLQRRRKKDKALIRDLMNEFELSKASVYRYLSKKFEQPALNL